MAKRRPRTGDEYASNASGKTVNITECFETRPDEWWVSFQYMQSWCQRTLTLEQFQARFALNGSGDHVVLSD